MSVSAALPGAILATFLASASAHATTYDLFTNEQGWINQGDIGNGTSNSNNYFAGNLLGNGEFRNFFEFLIPALDGPIVSASLVLNTFAVVMNQGPQVALNFTSTSSLHYIFLGTGTPYGIAIYSTADSFRQDTVALNSAAFSDIGTGGIAFFISGRITSALLGSQNADEYAFGNSQGSQELIITTADATTLSQPPSHSSPPASAR